MTMTTKTYFCAMLDMSRNGVMKPSVVKRYIDILAKMGYNSMMLYTEDTYEVENEPYFGYLRGRYSMDELRGIDAYACSHGVELIPCVQTLAHLNGIFRWPEYQQICDVNDILLIEEDRTYLLIENMFKTLSKTFRSKIVLIGMDEAHLLGRGKYADKHDIKPKFELMKQHLDRVTQIAEKYGFSTLMWSDMFLRFVNNGEYYGENSITEQVESMVPKNVKQVYWDYYHTNEKEYEKYVELHGSLAKDLWFAGGTWCWAGFVPQLEFAMKSTYAAMRGCRCKGVQNIIMTLWGDNGRECSCFTSLPILYYAIQVYKGNENLKSIKAGFEKIVGVPFDDFLLLEYPNQCPGNLALRDNPSKYMFYNDVFNGLFDANVHGGEAEYYKKGKYILSKRQNKNLEYSYLFNFEKELCSVLEKKYELGVQTRNAYLNNDTKMLKELLKKYMQTVNALRSFLQAFQDLWDIENKPQGFEIHQHRIGGLIQRILSCKEKLEEYLEGKISEIPELNEELLDVYGLKDKKNFEDFNCWQQNITVNIL